MVAASLAATAAVTIAAPAGAATAENGKIVFVSQRDKDLEIYSMNSDGSEPLRLTTSPGDDYHPSWSPDKKRIAFVSRRDGTPELYVMNADGTAQTRLTTTPGSEYDPAWSPDGSTIVFGRSEDWWPIERHLWTMKADGSGQTRLTNTSRGYRNPSFSPDGRWLVYERQSDTAFRTDIFISNADGTNEVLLRADAVQPAWSPDGSKLVFGISWIGSSIGIINADGTGFQQLQPSPNLFLSGATWSPDGLKLVLITSDTGDADSDVSVVNIDGTGMVNLTRSTYGPESSPDWGRTPAAPPATPTDTAPATVTVTVPAHGAAYSLGQVVNADFSCSDPSGVKTCVGPVDGGAAIDTRTAGTHTFTVTTADNAGNAGMRSVTYTVLAGNGSAEIAGGGTVTSDPGGVGASAEVPVQTSITAPTNVTGTVSITPQPTTGGDPVGFSLFDKQIVLAGPAATATAPYQVTFTVDSTALDGIAPADVQVFRNGVRVGGCTDPTSAVPDPCIASRGFGAGGDALVTVRTSQFSTWSLGRLNYQLAGPYQPVDPAPAVNSAKAGSAIPVKFTLGGDKGLDVFAAGYPRSGTANCGGGATGEIEESVAGTGASLTYDPVSTQYTYTWKPAKTMTGCRELILAFRDGSRLTALFNLR